MCKLFKIIVLLIGLSVNTKVMSQSYAFFLTQNYHNQLRLNTKTGEVYQVQDDGGCWIVNYAFTSDYTSPYHYWLYPTQNKWTFILINLFTCKL